MNFNPEHFVRVYLLVFILVVSTIFYAVYQQVLFVKKQRREILKDFQDDNSDNITYSDYLEIRFREKRQNMQNIIKMKSQIKKLNMAQTIHNKQLGPINNDTIIIVIQVHSNSFYLQQLLKSLKYSYGINKVLLIFSHDYYNSEINRIIKKVNFARYIQIFYPYSIQLHPNVFPGQDNTLCTEGFICEKSTVRDPEAAQMKHHWWWQANQVFDNMEVTQPFNQSFLFLEEGDYVTEDFLHAFKLIKQARYMHCPYCELLSLAAHEPDISQYNKKTMITVEIWTNIIYKSGIAFNRKIWNALKTYKKEFCYHNDYNWDSSFRHVGIRKWEGNIYMTAIAGPRVFHLEKCDDKDVGCKMEYKVEEVKKFIKLISKNFYSWGIVMVVKREEEFNGTALGYWTDERDRELCMYFTENCVW